MRLLVIKGSEIINIGYPFPINNPEEGLQPDGNYVIYRESLDGLSHMQFMQLRYWDGSDFQVRPPKPSIFCYWDMGTLSWKVKPESYMSELRRHRNIQLALSDWTQLADAPISESLKLEYQVYRQALRDMTVDVQQNPDSYLSLDQAPWPVPPNAT